MSNAGKWDACFSINTRPFNWWNRFIGIVVKFCEFPRSLSNGASHVNKYVSFYFGFCEMSLRLHRSQRIKPNCRLWLSNWKFSMCNNFSSLKMVSFFRKSKPLILSGGKYVRLWEVIFSVSCIGVNLVCYRCDNLDILNIHLKSLYRISKKIDSIILVVYVIA